MRRRGAILVPLLALALASPTVAGRDGESEQRGLVLGNAYPLEVRVSFHAALFHWVDSLAGTSGGKTVPAHRREYDARIGKRSAAEAELLARFRSARIHDARRRKGWLFGPRRGFSSLRRTFLEADDLATAFEAADGELYRDDLEEIREALQYFGPKYETIWQDGHVPARFVARFERDPKRHRLDALLAKIALFLEVDVTSLPRPVVVPVPVPTGHGTHATAVGPYLLIEVRPPDRLAQQANVIVHENAHYLFSSMDAERLARLEAVAEASGSRGMSAWLALDEALPTALGQGVADRVFRPLSWSKKVQWYHAPDVDTYAKAIYPLVLDALASGRSIDEAFVKNAIDVYPR